MIPTLLTRFISENKNLTPKFSLIPDNVDTVQWVLSYSGAPWIDMQIPFPRNAILAEARSLKHEFVKHRNTDGHGWSSLTIHGTDKTHTMSPRAYGLGESFDLYRWTEIENSCPNTVEFLKSLPGIKFARVRFMLLEPNGYILPHQDNMHNYPAAAMNISLNHPDNCFLVSEGHGAVPFSNNGSTIFFNNYYQHAAVNLSSEDRFHIIIHGIFDFSYWGEQLVRCYNAQLQ
jgi:hypothetical protein